MGATASPGSQIRFLSNQVRAHPDDNMRTEGLVILTWSRTFPLPCAKRLPTPLGHGKFPSAFDNGTRPSLDRMARRLLTCAVAAIAATTGHSFLPLASPASPASVRHAPPSSANVAAVRRSSGGPAWATPTLRPGKHEHGRTLAVRLAKPTSPLEEKEEDEFDEVCCPADPACRPILKSFPPSPPQQLPPAPPPPPPPPLLPPTPSPPPRADGAQRGGAGDEDGSI